MFWKSRCSNQRRNLNIERECGLLRKFDKTRLHEQISWRIAADGQLRADTYHCSTGFGRSNKALQTLSIPSDVSHGWIHLKQSNDAGTLLAHVHPTSSCFIEMMLHLYCKISPFASLYHQLPSCWFCHHQTPSDPCFQPSADSVWVAATAGVAS